MLVENVFVQTTDSEQILTWTGGSCHDREVEDKNECQEVTR